MSRNVALINPHGSDDSGNFKVEAHQISSDGVSCRFDLVIHNRAQDQIFNEVGKEITTNFLKNPPQSSIVLAYGATGSGKTFAVTGGAKRFADRGLIPRAVSYVFDELLKKEKQHPPEERKVYITFYEIYKDAVIDLLIDSKNKMQPKFENGQVRNLDLAEKLVSNESEAYHLLFQGDANRHFERLDLNPETSRGHTFFCLHIVDPKTKNEATMSFIDLATKISVKNLATHCIVKSLEALSDLLDSVGASGRDVAWGSDPLSVVLRPTLLERNVSVLSLCCIKLDAGQKEETQGSLNFAAKMRNVVASKAVFLEQTDGGLAPPSRQSQNGGWRSVMTGVPAAIPATVSVTRTSELPAAATSMPPTALSAKVPIAPQAAAPNDGTPVTLARMSREFGSHMAVGAPVYTQAQNSRLTLEHSMFESQQRARTPSLGSPIINSQTQSRAHMTAALTYVGVGSAGPAMGSPPIPRLSLNGVSSAPPVDGTAFPLQPKIGDDSATCNNYRTMRTSLYSAQPVAQTAAPNRSQDHSIIQHATSVTRFPAATTGNGLDHGVPATSDQMRTRSSSVGLPAYAFGASNAYNSLQSPQAYSHPGPGAYSNPPHAGAHMRRGHPGATYVPAAVLPKYAARCSASSGKPSTTTSANLYASPMRGSGVYSPLPVARTAPHNGVHGGMHARGGRIIDISPIRGMSRGMAKPAYPSSPQRDNTRQASPLSWGIQPCRLQSPPPLGLPISASGSPFGRAPSPLNQSPFGSPLNAISTNPRTYSPMRNAYAYDQKMAVPPAQAPRIVHR